MLNNKKVPVAVLIAGDYRFEPLKLDVICVAGGQRGLTFSDHVDRVLKVFVGKEDDPVWVARQAEWTEEETAESDEYLEMMCWWRVMRGVGDAYGNITISDRKAVLEYKMTDEQFDDVFERGYTHSSDTYTTRFIP